MYRLFIIFLSFFSLTATTLELDQCQNVRLADIGWTDVTSTTALAAELLHSLNYKPKISVLSTPVTLAALKNNDLDIFLGNWMPTQEADVRPYLNENSVIQLQKNLSGAKFSLAVPKYVYDAGIKNIADLNNHKEKFGGLIYGIESGNDGNRLILDIIHQNAFNLGQWQIVESSEQGMLSELKQKIAQNEYIVFLAWAPHPMNLTHELEYLSGQENFFGPNFGQSQVFTLTRSNFDKDCPNLAIFFNQLVFNVDIENQIMNLIINEKLSPKKAVQSWLKSNSQIVKLWLQGVKSKDNLNGFDSFTLYLNTINKQASSAQFIQLPLGQLMEKFINFLTNNFNPQFRSFSHAIEFVIKSSLNFLLALPWQILILALCALSFMIRKSWLLSLMVFLGLLLIANLGLWVETMQTLVLVLFASLICIAIGVPLGIWAAHQKIVYNILRPVLDLMQTIPTFVYLIPTLMLFGLGLVPGLISTIIFAIPAPIRLTYLGIKNVPKDLIEACDSFGGTPLQRLIKVEIPSALPSIMAGLTQCIMLSLSMVVISALVGADGLGTPVVRALNTVNIKQGFEAGLAIVILAILLDRTLSARKI